MAKIGFFKKIFARLMLNQHVDTFSNFEAKIQVFVKIKIQFLGKILNIIDFLG